MDEQPVPFLVEAQIIVRPNLAWNKQLLEKLLAVVNSVGVVHRTTEINGVERKFSRRRWLVRKCNVVQISCLFRSHMNQEHRSWLQGWYVYFQEKKRNVPQCFFWSKTGEW